MQHLSSCAISGVNSDCTEGHYKVWCREPESNRHGAKAPRDFKSLASTYSAIPAAGIILNRNLSSVNLNLNEGDIVELVVISKGFPAMVKPGGKVFPAVILPETVFFKRSPGHTRGSLRRAATGNLPLCFASYLLTTSYGNSKKRT